MTTVASIGGAIVITIVASGAIVGDSSMRPVERVIIVVNREGRGFPTGRCRVAHRAIRRDIQGVVVGVGSLAKIGVMARQTLCGRTGIIAVDMAFGTIGYIVPIGQREKVVVYVVRSPARRKHIVAFQAIG